MGKKHIDVGDTVDEINAGAALIASAARKINVKKGDEPSVFSDHRSLEAQVAETTDVPPSSGPLQGVTQLYALDDTKPRPTHADTRIPREDRREENRQREKTASPDDPWVTGTVKMRNSKKRRLKKISLHRELRGLEPHQQKDLMDQALDYIFEKFGNE